MDLPQPIKLGVSQDQAIASSGPAGAWTKWYYDNWNKIPDNLRGPLLTAMQNGRTNNEAEWKAMLAQVAQATGLSPDDADRLIGFGHAQQHGQTAQWMETVGNDPKNQNLVNAVQSGAGQGGAAAVDPAVARRADITRQLQQFADMLAQPVVGPDGRPTDPIVKQLAQIGTSAGIRSANQSGIQGGAATSIGEASAMQNALPYLQQRQSLQAQALGMIKNDALTNEQLDQGAYGLGLQSQQLNNQVAMGNYNNQVNNAQSIGGTILGALGTGVGAYLGNPQLGAQIGTGLGGALGGMTVRQPSLGSVKPYGAS